MIRNRQSGFTLVDIIVAMAIFSITASIAVPCFLSMMPQWRLNGAARQVMGDLMAARMRAVEENTDVTVSYLNNHEYAISTATEQIDRKIFADYHDVTMDSFSNITFASRGTSTSFGSILLRNSMESTKTITVAITGRVKIN